MRILVCGGRDFGHVRRTAPLEEEPPHVLRAIEEYKFIHSALDEIIKAGSNITIISGGATGADSAVIDFAHIYFHPYEVYKADWNKYGKAAGFIRNKQMLEEGRPDLVVAFPGGKGTAMMVMLAKKDGVEVIEMHFSPQKDLLDDVVTFQTKRFQDIYIDRLERLGGGMASTINRNSILREVLKEEREWIENMGQEYDEIMQAQEIMEKSNGKD